MSQLIEILVQIINSQMKNIKLMNLIKTFLRSNQNIRNYLKPSVGNDVYNVTKDDELQITDTSIISYPNFGGYILQNWFMKRNDKKSAGKMKKNYDQQKQTVQQVIREQQAYLRSAIVPCILRQVLTIMNQFYTAVLNEQTLYKGVISHSVAMDFEQEVVNQWVPLEFNLYCSVIFGVHDRTYPKRIDIVIHQLIGLWLVYIVL